VVSWPLTRLEKNRVRAERLGHRRAMVEYSDEHKEWMSRSWWSRHRRQVFALIAFLLILAACYLASGSGKAVARQGGHQAEIYRSVR
jgi:hypothetical protein